MPFSADENTEDVLRFAEAYQVRRVLDIGPGAGRYADLLRGVGMVNVIDSVEIFKPYIEEFALKSKYNRVFLGDARHLSAEDFALYDLIIFGDVLEHMSREDSMALWKKAHSSTYGLISVPIVHWPQGAEYGNPYEVHVQEHLAPDDIRKDYGPFLLDKIYETTGTFIKDFTGVR